MTRNSIWRLFAGLRLETLESRTVLSGTPVSPTLYFEPAEPLAPASLCGQLPPGIYYDPVSDKLTIVGSAGADRVSVSGIL